MNSKLARIGCGVFGVVATFLGCVIGMGAFGAAFGEGEFGTAGRFALVAAVILVTGVASIRIAFAGPSTDTKQE